MQFCALRRIHACHVFDMVLYHGCCCCCWYRPRLYAGPVPALFPAQVNQDVAELTEATELLQLAAAELQAGQYLTTDSMAAISSRMSSIAALAAELLPRLSVGRLQDLLEQYGISCSGGGSSTGSNATSGSSSTQPPEWCGSPGELLMNLVPLLRLPVCLVGPRGRMLSSLGCTSTLQEQQHKGARQRQQQPKLAKGQVPKVEPVSDPFGSFGTALLQKPCEVIAHYLQRMFFRLLSVVPVEFMRDLHVPCQRTDARSRCMSYLPAWVTAQAVTIDKRTGKAHVTGPSSCAVSSSGSPADPAACASARQSSQQQGTSSCAAAGTGHTQQQQQGGLELCGFLHIRALAPGVQLPMVDGELSPEQQEVFRRAQEAAAVHHDQPVQQVPPSCPVGQASQGCGANPGVYYYFFPDIPAVLDHIILTQVCADCGVIGFIYSSYYYINVYIGFISIYRVFSLCMWCGWWFLLLLVAVTHCVLLVGTRFVDIHFKRYNQ
jgi:hypothetical protein